MNFNIKKPTPQFWTSYQPYTIVVSLTVATLAISIFSFYKAISENDSSKYLPIITFVIGLIFTFFQFFINIINNQRKKYFDLKYAFYKDTIKQIEEISEIVQQGFVRSPDMSNIMHQLTSKANEFIASYHTNREYLFPELRNENVNKFINIVTLLVRNTQKTVIDINLCDEGEEEIKLLRISWSNNASMLLNTLIEDKYNYYALIRKYL